MSDRVWNGTQMVYLPDPLPLPSVIALTNDIEFTTSSTIRNACIVTMKASYVYPFYSRPVAGALSMQPRNAGTNYAVPATAILGFLSGIPVTPTRNPARASIAMQGYSPNAKVGVGDDILYG